MEHIYKGILFIYDRHHLEHAGFICAKSHSCVLVGGSRTSADRSVSLIFFLFSFYVLIYWSLFWLACAHSFLG